jgi:hypothetical protein
MALSRDTAGKSYTCSNASCKKVFDKPIKVLNIQKAQEPYSACPFCLTPIINQDIILKEQKSEKPAKKEAEFVSSEKPKSCTHYLGYLSGQSRKSDFPDECLVCSVITKCMFAEPKTSN